MWTSVIDHVNPRSTVLGALSVVLFLSLTCSMSMQYGHADVPIAETAALAQPLAVGQAAPRFEVRTVENRPFVFDPREMERPVVLITFRGGWCPYLQHAAFRAEGMFWKIFDAMGIDVLFLSGDRPELLYRQL